MEMAGQPVPGLMQNKLTGPKPVDSSRLSADEILSETTAEASQNWSSTGLDKIKDFAQWHEGREEVRQTAMDEAPTEMERTRYRWMGKENQTTDQLATQAADREEARYQDIYRPHNQKIIESIGDNSIVNSAKKSLDQAQGGSEARRKRNLARYGVTESAFEEQNNNRRDKLSNALTRSSVLGDARLKQYQRDDMLRGEMINLGRNIAVSGQAGLDQAAVAETARRNQQAQMDAQASAQRMALAGTAVGWAVGGPVGGMIGGAIGSAID